MYRADLLALDSIEGYKEAAEVLVCNAGHWSSSQDLDVSSNHSIISKARGASGRTRTDSKTDRFSQYCDPAWKEGKVNVN